MKRAYVFASMMVLVSGCTNGDDNPGDGDAAPTGPDAPPGSAQGIERCAPGGGGTLQQIWSVSNQHGEIVALSLAENGVLVVTSRDGTVKQWALGTVDAPPTPTGQPIYADPFDARTDVVGAVAFSADGQFVLGGDETGHGLLWEAQTTALSSTISAGAAPMTAVALAPDSALAVLADASFGGNVRIWDLSDESLGPPLATSLWGIEAAIWPAAGTILLAGHNYNWPSIERRNATDADAADVWLDDSLQGQVRAVAITPDGTRVVGAGDGMVVVLNTDGLAAGPPATLVAGHLAIGVAITPSGDLFATAGSEGTIRLFDTATASEVARLDVAPPVGLAIDARGERLITATPDGFVKAFACR